jgi:hypothetical protein
VRCRPVALCREVVNENRSTGRGGAAAAPQGSGLGLDSSGVDGRQVGARPVGNGGGELRSGSMCCIGEVGRQVQQTAHHWSGWWLGWQASVEDSVAATSADAAVRTWWCRRRSLSGCLLMLRRGLRLCSGSEVELTDGAPAFTAGRRRAATMGRQPASSGTAPAARPAKAQATEERGELSVALLLPMATKEARNTVLRLSALANGKPADRFLYRCERMEICVAGA